MKAVICLMVLGFCAAVMAEQCRNIQDCGHVTCPENDYVLECHNYVCTCTHVEKTCAAAADCTGDCRFGWHCVDSKCRCGWGIGGK
ncbi:serine protease inhibitor Cvsi-2-like [Dreissena polymorpha]|uniref:Uncharacterized protein n=1 Tax=Dreissena polymorpha TaxID=45954 RepID=A0A9D4NB10_DREPO|nr:serine protease inhibitor Cvsi-2-like [Dreissena polymorpha]KAH3890484.1 hypothetical protein DPMN_014566 [Dreissena polymorpha]